MAIKVEIARGTIVSVCEKFLLRYNPEGTQSPWGQNKERPRKKKTAQASGKKERRKEEERAKSKAELSRSHVHVLRCYCCCCRLRLWSLVSSRLLSLSTSALVSFSFSVDVSLSSFFKRVSFSVLLSLFILEASLSPHPVTGVTKGALASHGGDPD